jgi:hypothetical protein
VLHFDFYLILITFCRNHNGCVDYNDKKQITAIPLPYFNDFLNDSVIYLYKVDAACNSSWFNNASRDVEDAAGTAVGQLQGTAEHSRRETGF